MFVRCFQLTNQTSSFNRLFRISPKGITSRDQWQDRNKAGEHHRDEVAGRHRQCPHFPDDFEAVAEISQRLNVTRAEQRFFGWLSLVDPPSMEGLCVIHSPASHTPSSRVV